MANGKADTGKIRDAARARLAASLSTMDPYTLAAEAGAIRFDDIYFLGLVSGAQSEALRLTYAGGHLKKPDVEKDPSLEQMGYSFVAIMLGSRNPEEIEEKTLEIHRKVTEYHNKLVKK